MGWEIVKHVPSPPKNRSHMRTYRESPIVINNRVGYYSVSVRSTEFKGSVIMTGYGDSGQFRFGEIDCRLGYDMIF